MAKGHIKTRVFTFSNYLGIDLPYFLSGGLWLTLSTIILTLSGIFLSALFARVLPKEIFGQYSFLVSLIGFLSITSLPGMGQALRQAVAENKDGFFTGSILAVCKWSSIGLVLLIVLSIYYYFTGNSNLSVAIFVSAIAFPITSAGSLFSAFLTGKKNFKLASIYVTAAQLSSVGATAFALWKFPTLINVALFSAWSSALAGVFFTVLTLKHISNKTSDNKLLDFGYHLSFSQVFTIGADYLDRFLVPLLLGFTNNAVYAFAILIPMQIHGFLKSFTILGQPKLADFGKKDIKKALLVKSFQLEIVLVFIVFLYILMTPAIFKILYPDYQGEAVFLSQLFSLSLLYYPGNILSLLFVKERKTMPIYQINIVYAVTTFVLLLILVPSLGLVGAVLAKIGVRFLQFATQLIMFIKLSVSRN